MDLTEGLILSSMMGNGGGSGGGGGNPGYHTETENLGTLIPQQTVFTEDGAEEDLEVTWPEDLFGAPDVLVVTFNGQTYECANTSTEMGDSYGATSLFGSYIWDTYPFNITFDGESATIVTQTDGSYTVSADACKKNVTVSDDFALARGYSVNENGVSTTPDFEDAVLSLQPTQPIQPTIPSISGKYYNVLSVNAGGDTMEWKPLVAEKVDKVNSTGLSTHLYRNRISRMVTLSYSGTSILVVKNDFNENDSYNMGTPIAPVTISLFSTDGLELVYTINTNRVVTLIYDKGTTDTTKQVYGCVTFPVQ